MEAGSVWGLKSCITREGFLAVFGLLCFMAAAEQGCTLSLIFCEAAVKQLSVKAGYLPASCGAPAANGGATYSPGARRPRRQWDASPVPFPSVPFPSLQSRSPPRGSCLLFASVRVPPLGSTGDRWLASSLDAGRTGAAPGGAGSAVSWVAPLAF